MKISRGVPNTGQTLSSHSARIEHEIKQLNGRIERLTSGSDELDASQQMLLDSYQNQMAMLKETLQQQTKNQAHKITSALAETTQHTISAHSVVEELSHQVPSLKVTFSINTYI